MSGDFKSFSTSLEILKQIEKKKEKEEEKKRHKRERKSWPLTTNKPARTLLPCMYGS